MFAVEEPASTKNVEDIKDTWVFERSDPALGHRPYATRCRHTGRLCGVEPALQTRWRTEGRRLEPVGAVPPIRWESRQLLETGLVTEEETG